MSNDANGDWVRARTPREEGDEWTEEQSEYGLAVEPDEWDDHASDQSVPVTPPRPRPEVVEPEPAEEAPGVVEPTGEELLQSPEALEQGEALGTDPAPQEVDADRDLHQQVEAQETADDVETVGQGGTETVPVMVDGEPEQEFLTGSDESRADEDAPGLHGATVAHDQPLVEGVDEPSPDQGREPVRDPDDPGFREEAAGVAGAGAVGAAALAYGDSEPAEGRDRDREVHDDLVEETGHDESAEPVTASGEVRTDDDVEITGDEELFPRDDADESHVAGIGDESPGPHEDLRAADEDNGDQTVDSRESGDDDLHADDDRTQLMAASADVDDQRDDDLETERTADQTRISGSALGDEPATQPSGASAAGAATGASMAGIYRGDGGEDTQVLDTTDYPDDDEREAEERRIQEQLAAERRARQERLGVVPTSSENETRPSGVKPRPTTDRWYGSLGLFFLRLVTAAVVGVTGYQMLTPIQETVAVLEPTMLPEPRLVAWIAGFTMATLAILLVLGFAQRLVGLLLMVYGIGMLVFLRLGTFNPFREGFEGFSGDKELLLVGIGLLLLLLGGGRWGIDGAIRGSRERARAERP